MTAHTARSLSNAFGYLRDAEVELLKILTLSLPPSPFVINIGAGVGTSGLTFLETRDDLFLVTVDIEGGISPTGGLGNEKLVLEKAGIPSHRYHQIHGDSIKTARNWAETSINNLADLIFVDGDHGAAYLAEEGPLWYAHLKPGGIIAFHDYCSDFWGALVNVIDNMGLGDPLIQAETTIAFKKGGITC